jgi:uncharacterized protein
MADKATRIVEPIHLLILGDVIDCEATQHIRLLAGALTQKQARPESIYEIYTKLFGYLAKEAESYSLPIQGNAWQNHLLHHLLESDNLLAQRARAGGEISQNLKMAAKHDLKRLQPLFEIDVVELVDKVRTVTGSYDLPGLVGFSGAPDAKMDDYRTEICNFLRESSNWEQLVLPLTNFYAQYDKSGFAKHRAWRWRKGKLEPVKHYDPQRLENLVGYERERAAVVANTEQFLGGYGANNVLLYGARGTGKSSTVKGLLNRYGDAGLRIIEVQKSELDAYPLIAETVEGRPEKFILFVDDLSFEAEEVGYKDLKALLEGNLEARPANLLIYATSNRRHLIKEKFGDNPNPADEEINAWDTVEEKISLADRFGLIITFVAPNQREYLAIVEKLAADAGINLEKADLHRRALQWEMSHSGRSGRIARQFVDALSGELKLQAGRE